MPTEKRKGSKPSSDNTKKKKIMCKLLVIRLIADFITDNFKEESDTEMKFILLELYDEITKIDY